MPDQPIFPSRKGKRRNLQREAGAGLPLCEGLLPGSWASLKQLSEAALGCWAGWAAARERGGRCLGAAPGPGSARRRATRRGLCLRRLPSISRPRARTPNMMVRDPECRGGPPLSPVRLHSRGRGRAASSEVRPESGQFRLHPGLHRGPSGAVRGAAGSPFGSGKLGLRQVSASRSFVYISVPWFPLCGLRASEVLRLARAAFQLPGPVVLSGGEHELFKTTRMGLCRSFVPDSLG